jgi:hypothetical protein
MEKSLGRITKVKPRSMWPNEATDFTPWLAKHLDELAKAIGLELEFESAEAAVGPYSADILARDIGTRKLVVVENQLEKTNHDHLGKSLTYAAVLDASAVVWIATDFTDEHKKTLDWLNDLTSADVSFYGVILELWQIDDSKPGVRFNVVSRPADIVRQSAISVSADELTDTRKTQWEFWTMFRERLLATGKLASVQTARPQYWYDVSLGRSGINLSNIVNTSDHRIGVRVYISNRVVDVVLPQLMEMKSEIEEEVGSQLEWDPNPENRDKIIALNRDANVNHRDKWDDYLQWMVKTTLLFRTAFSKRLKNMDFRTLPKKTNGLLDED